MIQHLAWCCCAGLDIQHIFPARFLRERHRSPIAERLETELQVELQLQILVDIEPSSALSEGGGNVKGFNSSQMNLFVKATHLFR